jgi:hypothetical protein
MVPVISTEDAELESDARLLWDSATSTLFVIWNHHAASGDEIRVARLDAEGQWSAPINISIGLRLRCLGLQVELTHASIDDEASSKATLVHAVWWNVDDVPTAEYALVAFESGQHVSTMIDSLDSLVPPSTPEPDGTLSEDATIALCPPLAILQAGSGVDIAYGQRFSSGVTRLRVDPWRIVSNARMWKPLGKTAERTGRSGLVASTGAPVEVVLSADRIVLYAPGAKFRYATYKDGGWSPILALKLDDEIISRHQLLQQLTK